MPRNHSEKHTVPPELWAYMVACEEWIDGKVFQSKELDERWGAIHHSERSPLLDACGLLPDQDEREWRIKVIRYVRNLDAS